MKPLSQGRELKSHICYGDDNAFRKPLSQGRELKCGNILPTSLTHQEAPLAGA